MSKESIATEERRSMCSRSTSLNVEVRRTSPRTLKGGGAGRREKDSWLPSRPRMG
jgi:hypothetical protein